MKQKMSFTAKLYFMMFTFAAVLSVFLFWSLRNMNGEEHKANVATMLTAAIIALCLAIFFGLLGFIRFLRSRSVSGGLFITTALSTAVFLGASRLVGMLLAPVALARNIEGGGNVGPEGIIVILAQVGLFAIWFAFLMFTIHVQVSPIKRVNHYLERILEGQEVRRPRIGKSRQFRELQNNLKEVSRKMLEHKEKKD